MHLEGTVLASLFGADGAKAFMGAYWPERYYVVHGPPVRLPEWMRTPQLESLEALADRYTGQIAFGKGAKDARTLTAEGNPTLLFKLGFTVYLADIAACLTGGDEGLRALERALGLPSGCSKVGAFASPPGDGVSWHFDGEDVISVQLQGKKTFRIAPMRGIPYPVGPQFGPGMLPAETLYMQAGEGFPAPHEHEAQTQCMTPGSVLFLPRGTWHTSVADEDSLSISIGLRPPPLLDHVLPLIRALLLQDAAWRRPLYGVGFADERRDDALAQAQAVIARLPQTLSQLSAEELRPTLPMGVSDNSGEQRLRFQQVPMSTLRVTKDTSPTKISEAHMGATQHASALTPGKRGIDYVHLRVTAWDTEWRERVSLDTVVPGHLAKPLAWLADSRAAFSIQDFAGAFSDLSDPDRRQLLTLLCKAGYLKALRFPLLRTKERK